MNSTDLNLTAIRDDRTNDDVVRDLTSVIRRLSSSVAELTALRDELKAMDGETIATEQFGANLGSAVLRAATSVNLDMRSATGELFAAVAHAGNYSSRI